MPKKKAKDRPEIEKETEGTISRRSVLKLGAVAGAAGVLAPSMMASREALAFDDPIPSEPVLCVQPSGPSPAHTPFADNFTAPFPAIPTNLSPNPQEFPNIGAGEADRAPHQRWS
jgi:hypothetical protein